MCWIGLKRTTRGPMLQARSPLIRGSFAIPSGYPARRRGQPAQRLSDSRWASKSGEGAWTCFETIQLARQVNWPRVDTPDALQLLITEPSSECRAGMGEHQRLCAAVAG